MRVIVYKNKHTGKVVVFNPAPGVRLTKQLVEQVTEGEPHKIMEQENLPDWAFRDAWVFSEKRSVRVDTDEAKNILHDKRRAARDQEMSPLDDIIAKKIPGHDPDEVERQRQLIREKYEYMQKLIDEEKELNKLKGILEAIGK